VEACRNVPGDWEALSRLGALHISSRQSEPFGQLFTRFVAERPLHFDAYELLFEVGLASGVEQHRRVAIQRLSGLPGGRALALSLNARLRARGKPGEAATLILRGGLDLTSPPNAEALATLVEILGQLDRHDRAVARANAAVAANPDWGRFYAIRAAALAGAGAAKADVREALERALELDGNLSNALIELGKIEEAEGNVDAAVRLFARATAIAPNDPAPQWLAVNALFRAGREAEADARLEALVGRHVEHADAVELMARRLEARGDDSERARQYARLAKRLHGSRFSPQRGQGNVAPSVTDPR
jgi:tetratricopeptide (TPR) repeat protein